MSDAQDEDDHGHADAHTHDFDGEPVTELAADEPRTPGWVPALGVTLFIAGGVYLLVASQSPGAAVAESTAPTSTAEAAAPAPSNTTRVLTREEMTRPLPTVAPGASVPQLTPEQLENLKKRIDQAKLARGQGSGQPTAAPPPPSAPPVAPPKTSGLPKAGAPPKSPPKPGGPPKPPPPKGH